MLRQRQRVVGGDSFHPTNSNWHLFLYKEIYVNMLCFGLYCIQKYKPSESLSIHLVKMNPNRCVKWQCKDPSEIILHQCSTKYPPSRFKSLFFRSKTKMYETFLLTHLHFTYLSVFSSETRLKPLKMCFLTEAKLQQVKLKKKNLHTDLLPDLTFNDCC